MPLCVRLAVVWAVLRRDVCRALRRPGGSVDAGGCDPEMYGRSGHWVGEGYRWQDEHCGDLPDVDPRFFCQEKLKCRNMLLVGDSTMGQFFLSLVRALSPGTSGLQGTGEDPDVHLSRDEADDEVGGSLYPCGLPYPEAICRGFCNATTTLFYVRNDHLNGPDYGGNPKTACAWHQYLDESPWVVLQTGTHVNDNPDLRTNHGHIWQRRARDLFSFLKKAHPAGLIWRTSYYGQKRHSRQCPDPKLIRDRPMEADEIDAEAFHGSWRAISDMNPVYMQALKSSGLAATILDVEPFFSMRGDCRTDYLHFVRDEKASPFHHYARMLQAFMP